MRATFHVRAIAPKKRAHASADGLALVLDNTIGPRPQSTRFGLHEFQPTGKQIADTIPISPEDFPERQARFESASDATVTVERVASRDTQEHVATLMDISSGGAKLAIDVCIPFEEAVRIRIKVPNLNVKLGVAADVCWARPAGAEGWTIGCAFKPPIPNEALTELAAAGYVERRRHSRFPIALRATACWELGETSIPVRLREAAEGGFSMQCSQQGKSGQRLLLHISSDGDAVSIPARIEWGIQSGDEYLIGCSFVNEKDYAHLSGHVESDYIHETIEPSETPRQSPWLRFGAVAAVTFFLTYAFLLYRRTAEAPRPASASDEAASEYAGVPDSSLEGSTVDEDIFLHVEPLKAAKADASSPTPSIESPEDDFGPPPDDEIDSAESDISRDDSLPLLTLPLGAAFAYDEAEPSSSTYSDWPMSRENRDDVEAIVEPLDEDTEVKSEGSGDIENPLPEMTPTTSEELPTTSPPVHDDANIQGDSGADAMPESLPINVPPDVGRQPPELTAPSRQAPQLSEAHPEVVEPPPGENEEPRPTKPPIMTSLEDLRHANTLFAEGSDLLRRGQFTPAAAAFRGAAEFDPGNALYVYLVALAEYQSGRLEAANQAIASAAELEAARPLENWGRDMQRIQGRGRVWLERARAEARRAR